MQATAEAEEKEKYEQCWNTEGYRNHSPGEHSIKAFEEIVQPSFGSSIIDFGSGTARASLAFAQASYNVTMLDITEQSMDDEVRASEKTMENLTFRECNLWDRREMSQYAADFGYCCDVMEHIPPEYTMLVLANIMDNVKEGAFFYICLVPDAFGAIVGKPLHLTVQPYQWWLKKLQEFGDVVDARDLIINGMYYVKKRK
jgi:2-polyprenyl-3-methyl-5-hydroxy-6-metoxy-1,4-benzoquinol methylase